MNKTTKLFIAALGAITLSANAAVIETFDYATGAITNKASTATGFTGNWALSHTAGTNYTGNASGSVVAQTLATPTGYGFTPTNNQFSIGGGGTAYTQLATTIASNVDQTFYTSFLLDVSAGGTNSSTFFNLGFAAINSASNDNTDFLNFGKSSSNANFGTTFDGSFIASNVVIDPNKNYFVVMKAEMVASGNDSLSIKIFESTDTISGTEPTNWDQVRTDVLASDITFTGFGMRTGSAQTMLTDEIRIGDSWSSVTVIPEPSTLLLLGVALGSLAIFRRRKA